MMNNKRFRHVGLKAVGVAALACTMVPATISEASVLSLTISGTSHQVGVRYVLTAQCDFTSSVVFTDNGVVFDDVTVFGGTVSRTIYPDANGVAQIGWNTLSPGAHTLTAEGCSSHTQTNTPVSIVVNVSG